MSLPESIEGFNRCAEPVLSGAEGFKTLQTLLTSHCSLAARGWRLAPGAGVI